MDEIKRRYVDEKFLDGLLGLESSKIGFYAEVKQKIQELEQINVDLRIKRNELQAIFNSIPDAVMIYNSLGQVESRNHVCTIKFPLGSIIGTKCGVLFHPDDKDKENGCPIHGSLIGETRDVSLTRRLPDRDLFFEVTATPILDGQGNPTRSLVFLRDVTERKNQETKLHQTAKLSSIGMLAAGVAHEINNPLTSVAGYAEALKRRIEDNPSVLEGPDMEVFPRYLDVIMREAYRCKSIIESLLSFSRKAHSAREMVNIVPLVQEVLELLIHKAKADNVSIVEEHDPDLPAVFGDANGLRQVVMNLTMNAIQAVNGSGMVQISTRHLNDEVRICVNDTGSGIPADKIEDIWDPFFTTKGVGEGLGLGLSVTNNIVKNHGGRIDVHSVEGQGTRFTVVLPINGETK